MIIILWMKAEDLKIPFTYEERRPIIMNRLWYVPERVALDDFRFPGWNSPDLFGNALPIHIEYCSGNGAWIIEKALQQPEVNFVAVELRFDRARKIWVKLHNMGIKNLIFAWAEGYLLTKTFIPDNSVELISINFPDPWPKRRHARHRLIQKPFLEEMARILRQNATLTFVTDDPDYSEQTTCEFQSVPSFKNAFQTPFIEPDFNYGSSFFDELWRSKGKTIRLHRFIKQ
jgi:tRNA (guanine-N7-)-methyltransferase